MYIYNFSESFDNFMMLYTFLDNIAETKYACVHMQLYIIQSSIIIVIKC